MSTIAQRLVDSCTKGHNGCSCTTKVTEEEWQEAGKSDAERIKNLESIAKSAGKIGCDCHCTAALKGRQLSAWCTSDPTRHPKPTPGK